MMNCEKIKNYALLHIIIFTYSLGSVCSKMAAGQAFLSLKFILFYGGVLFLLFLYAIFWQQIIKKMPLTTAYANKAVVVIWGMIWGSLLFKENITIKMILGAIIILAGVYLVVSDDE
jgi:EamA-like transporter family.